MPCPPEEIADNHAAVLERIAAAAKRANRDPGAATLVAVTKTQSEAALNAILATGQTVFGENRVQEAQAHWGERDCSALSLHLIGPLQTNKSEDAVALFDVIETLDREKLARHIAKASEKLGRTPELFVQVNTGAEPQKAGVLPEELDAFLKTCRNDYDMHPTGLMCIPPIGQAASAHFWLLRELAERNGLSKLSMGMSADYETAIELGATHVRVGSGIFGARG